MPTSGGIPLKKQHGQYFLRDNSIVQDMLSAVTIKNASIFEIGCGDGFLTRQIIAEKPKCLWIFEIDKDWAEKVEKECQGSKTLTMYQANILDIDFTIFDEHQPWILLSNLPYHVTFPILKKVQKNKEKIQEGVIMVQEEVAQKIVKTSGRGYGYISLFFQYNFEWKLLTKVLPKSFFPQPKVTSRIMHFKPRTDLEPIPDEQEFWKFIKICFSQPRRTLRNNLAQAHINTTKMSPEILKLRAQQMSFKDLLELWKTVK